MKGEKIRRIVSNFREVLIGEDVNIHSEFSSPVSGLSAAETSVGVIHHFHVEVDDKEYLVSVVPMDLPDAAPLE